jgi:DNA-binding CsgD family transcriptional regulator
VTPAAEIESGREAARERAWNDAYRSLSRADQLEPLGAPDLELVATAAYMIGRDAEYLRALERAHHGYLDAGETMRGVRCAFWLSINLMLRGEVGHATGWMGRAHRLLEREGHDCVERGYLLLPDLKRREAAGDWPGAYAIAAQSAEIAERFGDRDLFSLAVHEQGRMLIAQGRIEEGLALLDEAMVAVAAGELSPIVTGLLYCSVIDSCQEAYALRRAREWTSALTAWCDEQPDMVAFTGRCLMHRAEIMQLHGEWPDAVEEARRAGRRLAEGTSQRASGQALYRQGEIHRLRGEFASAEEAYRDAGRCGFEPQPGLALLRLAQGNPVAAAAAIRRVKGEAAEPVRRAALLPAYIEITLAAGDVRDAAAACAELEEIAEGYERGTLGAIAAYARGAVDLARDDARAALVALRRAWQAWDELEAPYEAARARVLVGLACRELGDDDAAALELAAARSAFVQLGASPDVARVESFAGGTAAPHVHGLTARELQVLRLVAAGQTNKAIAAELVVSQRTVDRHVSNIFTKLGVSSRAAATAYAFRHRLV